jgi:hypothetical protein
MLSSKKKNPPFWKLEKISRGDISRAGIIKHSESLLRALFELQKVSKKYKAAGYNGARTVVFFLPFFD